MTKKNKILLFFTILLLGGLDCYGQQTKTEGAAAESKSASKNKKPKVVKVQFDDELVKGATEKPDLSNMSVKKNFNFKKLIRIRENFLNEMENGLDDFKGK